MPGGVNSPVRAFKSVGGQPIIFDRVKGCKSWDVDGNEYVDYVGSWGPAIIGACDDEVRYTQAYFCKIVLGCTKNIVKQPVCFCTQASPLTHSVIAHSL